jgi:signal transduction histidine kinase
MNHDTFWVVVTVALDLAVVGGYAVIAIHWAQNQRNLQNREAKRALGDMRNIFIFCALCGYLFIPIKMVWPAWRLYDLFLLVLVYFTWRYALGARELRVVYRELNKSVVLADELKASREASRRKSFFLNAVSHDLRTPLSAILLQGEVAAGAIRSNDPQQAEEALSHLRGSVNEVRSLLEGFLELGRLDWSEGPADFEVVDGVALARQVMRSHEPAAREKGLELSARLPRKLQLHTDPHKLERALHNLLSNAIKYTPQGQVQVAAGEDVHGWWMEVEDTGIGIEPSEQERIFDDFYQVRNSARSGAEGHGVGLAITRRMVEQLGGRIEIDSQPGRGSRFRLVLPRAGAVERPGGLDNSPETEDPAGPEPEAGGK